jgi:MoaA/NifB/PqqE/SkfB family radical SAM enzyme
VNEIVSELPVVILNVHSRCNCRCGMCDIWKVSDSREMPVSFVARQRESFARLGVKWVVLSGGEPLLHSDLAGLCSVLRSWGTRVTVLTSGLLIERHTAMIAAHVDDLILSLDGPAQIHDQIRGVTGAFELIRRGVSVLRRHRPDYHVAARCTVQKANHARLWDTVGAAHEIGVDSISFLAADITSTAFNRPVVWPEARQSAIALTRDEIGVLEQQILRLLASGDPIVIDSADHLRRITHRFLAYAGLGEHSSPRCNAPWVSAVVEVDGRLRPCFFHEPFGTINGDFEAVLNGHNAAVFRRSLDIATNPVCRRCVCSLSRPRGNSSTIPTR